MADQRAISKEPAVQPGMKRRKAQHTAAEEVSGSTPVAAEGLLIVDGTFQPVALDSGAEAILNDFNRNVGRSERSVTLPQEILDLLKTGSKSDLDATYMRIKVGSLEYGCRVHLIRPPTDAVAQPMLALYLRRELSVLDAVHQAGMDYHLTDREQEALIGVSMGLTSKELAERMDISPNTVKAFLRLIMIKMGVPTRTAIVGKLLDQNSRSHNMGA